MKGNSRNFFGNSEMTCDEIDSRVKVDPIPSPDMISKSWCLQPWLFLCLSIFIVPTRVQAMGEVDPQADQVCGQAQDGTSLGFPFSTYSSIVPNQPSLDFDKRSTSGGSNVKQEIKQPQVQRSQPNVTTVRINGDSAFAILYDASTGTNGFLNVGRDNIAGTTAMDFSYATPTENPDIFILVQGAGEIPNAAFISTQTTANLELEFTPFPVIRCEVNAVDATFTCAEGPSIPWHLTFAVNGYFIEESQYQTKTTIGPLTVTKRGLGLERSALINGTWNGNSAVDMNGQLINTKSFSVLREITMN